MSRERGTALTLVFTALASLGQLSVTPAQTWVARYSGPGGSSSGTAWSIGVDVAGNVYVTGESTNGGTGWPFMDCATIKYDMAGNQVWVARYDGPGGSWDGAAGLVVDAAGNVYVTGYSVGVGSAEDYATIKYDTAGNQIWVARYDGPLSAPDSATALAVDAAGNVYVTGSSYGIGSWQDYATIKYDANGNQVWVARYGGTSIPPQPRVKRLPEDRATALAVDDTGNVYVTGESGGSYDYATIKYDAAGNLIWVARYDGPAKGRDGPTALAVDSSGNVYVTGTSDGSAQSDYATVKYDAAGNQIWVARYDGPGGSRDGATALDVDATGNVYVTGFSDGIALYPYNPDDYATIKYDTAGNLVWVARYDGGSWDHATGLDVDAAGNVYVTGWSWSSQGGSDFATLKYDTDGNQIWAGRYDGPGRDRAYAFAVDGAGSVYVTGFSDDDFATVKYERTPSTYCTVGTSASGCTATISASGTASASAPTGFVVSAATAEGNKTGMFFFGSNGRQANPWGNGSSSQCVVPPVNRAGLLPGSGINGNCDGVFAQDLNAHWTARPAHNPGGGAVVQAQLWYRDPLNTSNRTTSLSDAIEFTVQP